MGNLRLVLGDQLSTQISSLSDIDKEIDTVLMCEIWDEATYVKHHKKKIAFLFSAMRHFAAHLKDIGYAIRYIKLDDTDNSSSFTGEVKRTIEDLQPNKVIVTEAGEYRVQQMIENWNKDLNIEVDIRPDNRFLATHTDFQDWAKGRKTLRMEYFYREMRKKYDVLMTPDGSPEGGEWNYDDQNRKSFDPTLDIPKPYTAQIDKITQDVIELVSQRFESHFGDLEPFYFAVTREQALYALEKFIEERLSNFGDYQDAMVENEPWLFHSHLSFYINCGLLLPLEVIKKAEDAYYNKKAPLNAVEGFIRQILGWREYVRGIYWMMMPDYAEANYLNAKRNLPSFFWDANTKMNCMRQSIKETKENAYAHHIQRLMVIGNFCLIAGLSPDEVNEWYLLVYADAYEWVEMPNVTGMILFADGGKLASKPYAASGSYINKMSDYCKNCSYSVTKKNGPKACPFNYLYWNFMDENKDTLEGNPRLGFSYRTLNKMSDEKRKAIRNDALRFFKEIEIA